MHVCACLFIFTGMRRLSQWTLASRASSSFAQEMLQKIQDNMTGAGPVHSNLHAAISAGTIHSVDTRSAIVVAFMITSRTVLAEPKGSCIDRLTARPTAAQNPFQIHQQRGDCRRLVQDTPGIEDATIQKALKRLMSCQGERLSAWDLQLYFPHFAW